MSSTIGLDEAIHQIAWTFRRLRAEGQHPSDAFFFFVGAGVSAPQVPLASSVQDDCRRRAIASRMSADLAPPSDSSVLEAYSYWFRAAFPQPIDRQKYLRELIADKPISPANLRLAHLLSSGMAPTLVVTPNFDDFLSRALTLFGVPHVLCDHPATAERIDAERTDDIQILHVHGTYWFYDLRNLPGEIAERAQAEPVHQTIASRLDLILANRSPLVLGYSGWEQDVFMRALKRRLSAYTLRYNLYWFCYRRDELPLSEFLHDREDVVFVVPEPTVPEETTLESAFSAEQQGAGSGIAGPKEKKRGTATAVFEALIRELALEAPLITRNPLGYYANHLQSALVVGTPSEADTPDDFYGMNALVDRLNAMAPLWSQDAEERTVDDVELEAIRDALRRSQYREAIARANTVSLEELPVSLLPELADVAYLAAVGLLDNSTDELLGYEIVVRAVDLLQQSGEALSARVREQTAISLYNKGVTLGNLGRSEEAIGAYDEVVRRFDDDVSLREQVGKALFNKGFRLAALDRSEEAIEAYEEVVRRFGEDEAPALREQVARALVNKGVELGALDRGEEAIGAYEEVVRRFGEDEAPALREQVARALVNKGFRLGVLDRSEEEIEAYEEVVRRFGEDEAPALREQVAKALFNKGVELGALDRGEEAIEAYEEVVRRFGEDEAPALREQVVRALFNKGFRLGALDRSEEAIEAYEEVARRFGEDEAPALREQVAKALVNKGFRLGVLDRSDEEIEAYEEVVRRFGEDEAPALREQVARALVNKIFRLGVLGRADDASAVCDDVLRRFGDDESRSGDVAMALVNRSEALLASSRQEAALTAADQVLGRFQPDDDKARVRQAYAEALLVKSAALRGLDQAEAALDAYRDVVRLFSEDSEADIQQLVQRARDAAGELAS